MIDGSPVDNEPDGVIGMPSKADQSFMDTEVEDKGGIDEVTHYKRMVEYFEERGWHTDRLVKPEGVDKGED